jgi:hypothetical protein
MPVWCSRSGIPADLVAGIRTEIDRLQAERAQAWAR